MKYLTPKETDEFKIIQLASASECTMANRGLRCDEYQRRIEQMLILSKTRKTEMEARMRGYCGGHYNEECN